MPAPNEIVYPVVPKCPTGHAGARAEQASCPDCIARKRYVERIRKWEIRHGERPARQIPSVERKAHRCPQHSLHTAGCTSCRDWSRYEAAVRRDRERRGVAERSVPVAIVQEHLKSLLDKRTGGWTHREIISRSGVGENRIGTILSGGVKTVYGSTWAALEALQPLGRPPIYGYHRDHVPSLEAARIVQGLLAQAWTAVHMAGLIGQRADDTILQIARHKRAFMRHETREKIRGLVDKLGPYDGTLTGDLLPGMSLNTASNARRRGFVPLAAWAGQDLADPDAVPGRGTTRTGTTCDDTTDPIVELYDNPCGADRLSPVDSVKLARVRALREQLLATGGNRYRPDAYIRPLGALTRLELHVIVAYATHLGMSAAEVAELIGYPANTDAQIENGQRKICLVLADVRSARERLDQHHPGQVAPWIMSSGRAFRLHLSVLLAMQPAPVGRGMTCPQVAAFCGVSEDIMDQYLTRIAVAANRPWQPMCRKKAKKTYTRTTRPAQAAA